MLIPTLAAALLSATATADDATLTLHASVSGAQNSLPEADSDALAGGLTLGSRLQLGRVYGTLEGQGLGDGLWTGRASAGLDLLKRVDAIDVEVGIFAGAGGAAGSEAAPMIQIDPAAGYELGLGVQLHKVSLHYRHARGLAGDWQDERVQAGFTVTERVDVFARYQRFMPQDTSTAGISEQLGAGVALRF